MRPFQCAACDWTGTQAEVIENPTGDSCPNCDSQALMRQDWTVTRKQLKAKQLTAEIRQTKKKMQSKSVNN